MQTHRKPPPPFEFGPTPAARRATPPAAAPSAAAGGFSDDDLYDLSNAIMLDVREARTVEDIEAVFDRNAGGLRDMIRRRPDIAYVSIRYMGERRNIILDSTGG